MLFNEGIKEVMPESEPVVFNFRMPQDSHRIMLFDKIYFLNKDRFEKARSDTSRETNARIVENIDYEELINTIKKLYKVKLTASHIQFE